MSRTVKGVLYIIMCLLISQYSKATTYLHCSDKTLKSCKEVTKGQAVKISALDDKAVIVKQDLVKLGEKGTLTKAD